jgi:putative membrane protein
LTDQLTKQAPRLDELAVERNRLAVERNELAVERNELANERTILAYARTSIMGFLTGVTLFKLFPENTAMTVLGWVSVGASAAIVLIGLFKFLRRHRSLSKAHTKQPTQPH